MRGIVQAYTERSLSVRRLAKPRVYRPGHPGEIHGPEIVATQPRVARVAKESRRFVGGSAVALPRSLCGSHDCTGLDPALRRFGHRTQGTPGTLALHRTLGKGRHRSF